MIRLFLVVFIISSFFSSAFCQDSQLEETTYQFIENINNNDFKSFSKSFSPLVRLVLNKSIRREAFESFREKGEWVLSNEYRELSPNTSLTGFYNASDTLQEVQYVQLKFNKKYKLYQFGMREANIEYPLVTEQTSMEDIVSPYMKFKNNSGLAIGIYHNGEKHFFEYGELEKDKGVKPDQYSLYQIGSLSKVLTGTLLAQMHVQNKLSIYDSVNKFLPSEIPSVRNKKREVQLVDLATHSARLIRDPDFESVENFDEDNPFVSYRREDLYKILQEPDIDKKLGERYDYSNVGVGMLGLILSDFEKDNFQNTLSKYVLSPIGMDNTTVFVDENNQNKATSYAKGEKVDDMITNDAMVAAGGIYSCTDDMVKFIENVLKPSNDTIAKSMDLATKVHLDENKTLGLNWFYEQSQFGDWKWLKHGGNSAGSTSMLLVSKERNFGIVVFGNSSVDVDDLALKIAELYLKN